MLKSWIFGDGDRRSIRLPPTFRPLEYDLRVWPHVLEKSDWMFEGDVQIRMECRKWTRVVTLHARDLAIDEEEVKVTDDEHQEIRVLTQTYDRSPEKEFYLLHLEEELDPGQVISVFIPFSGKIDHIKKGIFYEVYDEESGEDHMVATHFQPTHARTVFPCFDEPQFKTPFRISVARPRNGSLLAYSNMPVAGTKDVESDRRYVWDVCQESPPMPTYLVTFVVANYKAHLAGDWFQRVICRPSVKAEMQYALKVAPYVLSEIRSLFRTPYTLPKLDHISIVGWIGGMEHYGLISYGEDSISVDPDLEGLSYNRRKNMALSIICHETCHMWLGNLVTTKWWDTIWLNEGLTQFFTHYVAGRVDPYSNSFEMLPVSLMERAMLYDQERTATPMVDRIKEPSAIADAFNAKRTYYRGAAITNMMMHMMTESRFMTGMVSYIKRFADQSVGQSDFFDMINTTANLVSFGLSRGHSVEDVMGPWTKQAGFPLVTVVRDYDKGTTTFSQKRFRSVNMNFHADDAKWIIPITYTTEVETNFKSTTPDFWLTGLSEERKVAELDDDEWLLVNIRRTGYYRVNYDHRNWEMLVEQLRRDPSEIHVINRAQIISDAFVLATYNLVDWSIVEGLSQYLKEEEDFLPWMAASKHVYTLAYYLPNYKDHRQWAAQLILDGQAKLMATSTDASRVAVAAEAASNLADALGVPGVGRRKVAAAARRAAQQTSGNKMAGSGRARRGADRGILASLLDGLQRHLSRRESDFRGEFLMPEETFWDRHICRLGSYGEDEGKTKAAKGEAASGAAGIEGGGRRRSSVAECRPT